MMFVNAHPLWLAPEVPTDRFFFLDSRLFDVENLCHEIYIPNPRHTFPSRSRILRT